MSEVAVIVRIVSVPSVAVEPEAPPESDAVYSDENLSIITPALPAPPTPLPAPPAQPPPLPLFAIDAA